MNATQLAQELIRIPSLTGHEAQVAAFINAYLSEAGFQVSIDDHGAVIAVLTRGEGPTVLLDAHIDTVDADAAEWAYPPFAGEIADGRLYGRGATDMKGAMAAMMRAGKRLAREAFAGTLAITGTSWEEHFEGYTLGIAIQELTARGMRPDYVIIGEASELNVKRGQRGRTRIHFDVRGRPAHSAHPARGINAVYKATKLIQAIQDMPLPHDPFLGDGIVELIGIDSLPKPIDSVVPYACRVSYDLRLLPGQTPESVLAQFSAIVDALSARDPEFAAEISIASGELVTKSGREETVRAFPPAWKLEEDHPLVRGAVSALRAIGQNPAITKYDFCTNGSYSAGMAGIPTIGYGPGSEDGAHIVDEFVEVAELESAFRGYMAIARALLSR